MYLKPWSNGRSNHDVYPRHVAKRDYLQFPYLQSQWNIEGMFFWLHIKRLNPNLRKKFKNKFKFLNLILNSNFITYNNMLWKESIATFLRFKPKRMQCDRLHDPQNDDLKIWHLRFDLIGLLSFDDHFRIFT